MVSHGTLVSSSLVAFLAGMTGGSYSMSQGWHGIGPTHDSDKNPYNRGGYTAHQVYNGNNGNTGDNYGYDAKNDITEKTQKDWRKKLKKLQLKSDKKLREDKKKQADANATTAGVLAAVGVAGVAGVAGVVGTKANAKAKAKANDKTNENDKENDKAKANANENDKEAKKTKKETKEEVFTQKVNGVADDKRQSTDLKKKKDKFAAEFADKVASNFAAKMAGRGHSPTTRPDGGNGSNGVNGVNGVNDGKGGKAASTEEEIEAQQHQNPIDLYLLHTNLSQVICFNQLYREHQISLEGPPNQPGPPNQEKEKPENKTLQQLIEDKYHKHPNEAAFHFAVRSMKTRNFSMDLFSGYKEHWDSVMKKHAIYLRHFATLLLSLAKLKINVELKTASSWRALYNMTSNSIQNIEENTTSFTKGIVTPRSILAIINPDIKDVSKLKDFKTDLERSPIFSTLFIDLASKSKLNWSTETIHPKDYRYAKDAVWMDDGGPDRRPVGLENIIHLLNLNFQEAGNVCSSNKNKFLYHGLVARGGHGGLVARGGLIGLVGRGGVEKNIKLREQYLEDRRYQETKLKRAQWLWETLGFDIKLFTDKNKSELSILLSAIEPWGLSNLLNIAAHELEKCLIIGKATNSKNKVTMLFMETIQRWINPQVPLIIMKTPLGEQLANWVRILKTVLIQNFRAELSDDNKNNNNTRFHDEGNEAVMSLTNNQNRDEIIQDLKSTLYLAASTHIKAAVMEPAVTKLCLQKSIRTLLFLADLISKTKKSGPSSVCADKATPGLSELSESQSPGESHSSEVHPAAHPADPADPAVHPAYSKRAENDLKGYTDHKFQSIKSKMNSLKQQPLPGTVFRDVPSSSSYSNTPFKDHSDYFKRPQQHPPPSGESQLTSRSSRSTARYGKKANTRSSSRFADVKNKSGLSVRVPKIGLSTRPDRFVDVKDIPAASGSSVFRSPPTSRPLRSKEDKPEVAPGKRFNPQTRRNDARRPSESGPSGPRRD
jgi:hypothetical protein